MVPVLAALGRWSAHSLGFAVPAIGVAPALLALSLYGTLPILQNVVAGLAGVDPALREAARAMGMTGRQRLWRVELPLALPVMIAPTGSSGLLWPRGEAEVARGCAAA